MLFLGSEARNSAFEKNIGDWGILIAKAGLQGGVSKLGILNRQNEFLGLFDVGGSNGEGARVERERMKAEGSARDDAERAESAGDEFGKIVTGDVFYDFAAAAGERAVRKSDGDSDDEVAKRAEAQTQSAAFIGRQNAADGSFFRPEGVEREALAVLRESLLQFLDRAASFDSDSEVGPGVLDDLVEACSGQDQISARGRIAPGELRAATTRNDGQTLFVGEAQCFGEFFFRAWFDDEFWLSGHDGIG